MALRLSAGQHVLIRVVWRRPAQGRWWRFSAPPSTWSAAPTATGWVQASLITVTLPTSARTRRLHAARGNSTMNKSESI